MITVWYKQSDTGLSRGNAGRQKVTTTYSHRKERTYRKWKKLSPSCSTPQDREDTQNAIKEAWAEGVSNKKIRLEPEYSLIKVECLALLTDDGFVFSPCSKSFVMKSRKEK